jgi:uncharacterized tellurite resistance protein B-like protein
MGILDRLKEVMQPERWDSSQPAARPQEEELHLAAAVLLVEAASMDDVFDDAERGRVEALLRQRFGLDGQSVRELLEVAEQRAANSVEWQGYTRVVKERFDQAERIQMLEMLWEVAYADGTLHDYEASLLRRITGLLYVTDRESGEARKRVLVRLGLQG